MSLDAIRPVTTAMVLENLGNPTLDANNNYTVFGMSISSSSIAMQIENAYDYVSELVGDTNMSDSSYYKKIRGFIADYATLRIFGTLAGISIPTHFNYTVGGLNIQKPVVSQMRTAIEMYMYSCKRWQKALLRRGVVNKLSDLEISIPNEKPPTSSGILEIRYDAQSL